MISKKRIVSLFISMSGQVTMIVQEISRLDFGRLAKERNRKYKIQKILDALSTWYKVLYIVFRLPFPLVQLISTFTAIDSH